MFSYPHWYQESPPPLTSTPANDGVINWSPLWKYDSDILEIENDSRQVESVYVRHRRERVDLAQRQISSCYDSSLPSRRIIRGTWFYYFTPAKAFYPFSEDVAKKIELWFQGLKALTPTPGEPIRSELEMNFTLPHRANGEVIKYKLLAIKEIPTPEQKTKDNLFDGFSVTMRSTAFNDFFTGTIQLERGARVTPDPEEAWCGTEADQLVFVVHGIGQALFAKSETSFKHQVSSLSKLTMEQQEALFQTDLELRQGAAAAAAAGAGAGADAVIAPSSAIPTNPTQTPTIISRFGNKKRIEYIPIEWYDIVRSEDSPLAKDLGLVTLPNIQVVRQIANEVVLDILLYLTPQYREKILTFVCSKIVEMYSVFVEINPNFLPNGGKCSLIGHSLGTVILFDLLANQRREAVIGKALMLPHLSPSSLSLGTKFTLPFRPHAFMAMGSPLGLFFSIRNSAHSMMFGQVKEHESDVTIEDVVMSQCFVLPTCSTFYNVFHPHDPVAYRIEPLLDPALFSKAPVVVIHHKGGFRAHYVFKNIATQITDTVSSVFNPAGWFTSKVLPTTVTTSTAVAAPPPSSLSSSQTNSSPASPSTPTTPLERANSKRSLEECPADIPQVALNAGRRIDYMLQETGLENANEYVSSITSHTGYFDMKDVARFIVVNIWARD
jgi:hypothetical protein